MPGTTKKRLMPEESNRLLLHEVPVPPLAHAYHHWDESTRTLTYAYNKRRVVSIRVPGTGRVSYRHGSDGTLQGSPFFQQVYMIVEGGTVTADVTFQLSANAVNLRPSRANREQAIVGQLGRPLLPKVNGLYDVSQDLMLSWFGHPWQWTAERLVPDADGQLTATMQVELGSRVWVLNVKPHYYNKHLGYRYHQPWQWQPNPKPIAGWCSWEAYRRDVTEEQIVAAADFCAKHLRAYGLEYVQIDDGYEKLPFPLDPEKTIAENWLDTNDQFPSGHPGVVKQIRERGLQAGIWTNVSIDHDAWAATNPECLLRDKDGDFLIGDWIRYIVDCTPETFDRQYRACYRGLREAGYTYFKIDSIRHLLYDGLHEAVLNGLLSNDEAERRFRLFMEATREEIGYDVYWLSSWGVLTQMVGLCDACRIAQDAKPQWSGMQMQITEAARWYHAQRVLFTIDPDHVCVRAPVDWARCILSLTSLSGGLYMLSDPIESYDPERLRIIQQTLPPLATVTAETGPLDVDSPAFNWTKLHGFAFAKDKERFASESKLTSEEEARNMVAADPTLADAHPFSSLWAFHLDTDAGRWCVVGRFAPIPLEGAAVHVKDLALETDQEYLIFDFWKQEFLGRTSDTIECPPLPLGHCQVLALRPVLDRPQLLSSSRHISQDAVSVKTQTWANDTLTLELEGVAGTRETYWLHVPENYDVRQIDSPGFAVAASTPQTAGGQDRALPVTVAFPVSAEDRVKGQLVAQFTRT